ncbi:MAG: type II toxin-antitoxin system RelE/ParE family toxin [Candidatus Omnitrophota bacterium]|jgi:plasmid stabilization system protein ParE|nr:MAG: type II toxin-antitoxin system RelE/ParE family toxin [Candidatus Omnitrophota bacterium]
MNRRISFHEAAEIEINEAADFYDRESPRLGSAFLDEVQQVMESISRYPNAAPLIQGRVRKKILINFPYSLIYSVRTHEIRILAVAHQKRRPFYWRSRR